MNDARSYYNRYVKKIDYGYYRSYIESCKQHGRLHGYILTEEGALDAAKSKFWGNLAASIKHKRETGKSLVIPYVKIHFTKCFEDNEEVEKHGVPKVEN